MTQQEAEQINNCAKILCDAIERCTNGRVIVTWGILEDLEDEDEKTTVGIKGTELDLHSLAMISLGINDALTDTAKQIEEKYLED